MFDIHCNSVSLEDHMHQKTQISSLGESAYTWIQRLHISFTAIFDLQPFEYQFMSEKIKIITLIHHLKYKYL